MDEMEVPTLLQEAGAGDEEAGASDERRRDNLLYETPQQLLDLWKRDRPKLMRQIKQALDQFHRTGRLRPSDLKLHVQLSPYDTSIRPILGYEDGEYDPGKLGAACIVVPPTEGRGSNTKGPYSVHAVLPPSLLP